MRLDTEFRVYLSKGEEAESIVRRAYMPARYGKRTLFFPLRERKNEGKEGERMYRQLRTIYSPMTDARERKTTNEYRHVVTERLAFGVCVCVRFCLLFTSNIVRLKQKKKRFFLYLCSFTVIAMTGEREREREKEGQKETNKQEDKSHGVFLGPLSSSLGKRR